MAFTNTMKQLDDSFFWWAYGKKRGPKPRPPVERSCLHCGTGFVIDKPGRQNAHKKFCNERCATGYNMARVRGRMQDTYGPCLKCHARLFIPTTQSAALLGVSRGWVLRERHRQGHPATPPGIAAKARLWDGAHKRMLTIEERIKRMLRAQARRIKQPIKRMGRRSLTTNELLGCSYAEARAWIELKFRRGMGWHNTGEWEIDHVIPIAAFDLSNDAHVRRVNHYTNLQPLWRDENRAKSDRMPVGQFDLL
jgi:hypothetical protein